MSNLPRVMVGGPVRDRADKVAQWLGGLLATKYPLDLLSLCLLVNDCRDQTLELCRWWGDQARAEGWSRVEIREHNLGTTVDHNARGIRDYAVYARLRDEWAAMRGADDTWLYQVDSDIQVPDYLLQALVGIGARDGYQLLAGVIANNWAPAPMHACNVLVADSDGNADHSRLALASGDLTPRPCMVTGAVCVLHRSIFDAGVSYLDESMGTAIPEDNIFCARLLQRGMRVGYVPGLKATHWHQAPAETAWMQDADWWRRQAAFARDRAVALMAAQAPAVQEVGDAA